MIAIIIKNYKKYDIGTRLVFSFFDGTIQLKLTLPVILKS